MTDFILGTLLLVAVAAQAVVVMAAFGGGSRDSGQVPADWSGGR